MSDSFNDQVKCPSCGKHQGIYVTDDETYEEMVYCQACRACSEATLKRFGQESLASLRALLGTESKPRQTPKPEWSLELDHLLVEIAADCVKNGYCRPEEPLKTLRSILKRPFEERTPDDWEFLVKESRNKHGFPVFDDEGYLVYDYVEGKPKS